MNAVDCRVSCARWVASSGRPMICLMSLHALHLVDGDRLEGVQQEVGVLLRQRPHIVVGLQTVALGQRPLEDAGQHALIHGGESAVGEEEGASDEGGCEVRSAVVVY